MNSCSSTDRNWTNCSSSIWKYQHWHFSWCRCILIQKFNYILNESGFFFQILICSNRIKSKKYLTIQSILTGKLLVKSNLPCQVWKVQIKKWTNFFEYFKRGPQKNLLMLSSTSIGVTTKMVWWCSTYYRVPSTIEKTHLPYAKYKADDETWHTIIIWHKSLLRAWSAAVCYQISI